MSASTASSSSTHYYVPLPGGTGGDKGQPGSGGVVSPRLVRGQPGGRRCLSLSSGCLCLLILGLLLFFLVPRRPIVRYQSSTLALDEATAKVTLTQLFSYYNPNYYTVNWNKLHIEVEDEATHTPLGFGWRNVSFPVGALHSASVAVDITITAAYENLAPLIKAQCSDRGYVVFSSSGTVDAWIWSQNFGSLRIGPFREQIDCGELHYSQRGQRQRGQGRRRR